MIVECSHCQTKFNLPDDKVKPGGVKIRCTRCKNVFDVSPPADSPAMDDSFSSGLDDDLSGFDEDASDLSSDGRLDSDIPGDLDGDIGGDDLDLDTGDSDFSLDSDLDAGSDSGKTADSDSLEFDMDDQEEGAAGSERAAGLSDPGGGRSAADSDFTLEKELDDDLGDLDLSFDDGPAPAGKKAAAEAGSDFDLSFGPETAPLGADISPAPAAQSATPGDIPDDFEIGGAALPGGKNDIGFSDSIGIDSVGDPFTDIEGPAPTSRAKKKTARRSPLTVALLILLFLLAAGYWAYSTYFSEGFDPEKVLTLFSSNENPLANLENAELKMHYYYVMNQQLGKVLVLEGAVINHSSIEKGRIKVRLSLYDKSGNEIGKSESYCGNVLELSELETLSKAEITKLLSLEAGKKFDNAHIKPNGSIPYMVVVFTVPDATDGFVVTIIEAQNVGE
jgi:predicted Zn finger-like uncharacterized protein